MPFLADSHTLRLIQRNGYPGLEDFLARDIGTEASREMASQSFVSRSRPARSPSPARSRSRSRTLGQNRKRPVSPDGDSNPTNGQESQQNGNNSAGANWDRQGGRNDHKRFKNAHRDSISPGIGNGPSSGQRGPPAQSGPPPPGPALLRGREEIRGNLGGNGRPSLRRPSPPRRDSPNRERERERQRERDAERDRERERDRSGDLPAMISWFLTILPTSESFNGPILNPNTIADVISTAKIPTSFLPAPAQGGYGHSAGYNSGPPPQSQRRSLSPPGSKRRQRSPDYGEYHGRGGGGGGGGGGGRRGGRRSGPGGY